MKKDEIIMEIITDLLQMDIDEIESLRKKMSRKLSDNGECDKIVKLFDKIFSLAIERKEGIKYGERKSI